MYEILALIIGLVAGYVLRSKIGDELTVLHAKIDTLAAAVKAKL